MSAPSTHLSLLFAMQQEGCVKEQAWADFVVRYRQHILNVCICNGLPRRLAEDFSQEILVTLLKKGATYEPQRGRFRSWLGVVIHNYIDSKYRRKELHKEEPVGGEDGMQFVEQLSSPDLIDQLAASVDSYVDPFIEAAILNTRNRINPESWVVFEEIVLHGREVADVAKDLSITKGSAHMTKYRVTQILREEWRRLADKRHINLNDSSPPDS